jgi:hypothetical protein
VNSTSSSLNLTNSNYLFVAYVIVAYQSKRPDEQTVKEVLTDMEENYIDFSQMVE